METEKIIEEEVNKTLSALDGIPSPASDPFLFERFNERISRGENKKIRLPQAGRLKPVALALIILINIITAIVFLSGKENGAVKEQLISSLRSDYDSNQIDY